MNATATNIQFRNGEHKEIFEEMIGELNLHGSLYMKREQAVIYLISAMKYPERKELFHPLGRFPDLGKAVELYEDEAFGEKDAVIFALAMNFHNGQEVLNDFRIISKTSPYHLLHKLRRDSFVMGEAMKIALDGY